jgi:hypothetical protein
MARLWSWLVPSFAVAMIAYAALIWLSAVEIPFRPTHFDTQAPTTSEPGWDSDVRYFMLNKHRFSEPGDQMIVLGASTARDPFRPGLMQRALLGWKVANASLSGANISQIADEIDLIYREKAEKRSGKTIFVFALTYLQFRPTLYAEGQENPLATEAMRGSLYLRRQYQLVPRFNAPIEGALLTLFRPQAVAASLPHRAFKALFVNPSFPNIKAFVDRFRDRDPVARWTEFIGEHPDLNSIIVPPEMQTALMQQRLAATKGDTPLPPEEFVTLARTIKAIRSHGDGVVIVDLPLPQWHRRGAVIGDRSFLAGIEKIRAENRATGEIAFLSLREFDDDGNFFDSGHTKPRLWPVLSEKVAVALEKTLAETSPSRP